MSLLHTSNPAVVNTAESLRFSNALYEHIPKCLMPVVTALKESTCFGIVLPESVSQLDNVLYIILKSTTPAENTCAIVPQHTRRMTRKIIERHAINKVHLIITSIFIQLWVLCVI
jgi:hypothetical protein